jgi:Uma2 family endonuclease
VKVAGLIIGIMGTVGLHRNALLGHSSKVAPGSDVP